MSDEHEIGYAWDFNVDLGSGRIVSVRGNFGVGATSADMNTELDKVRSVLDRQQAKTAIPAVEAEVEQCERTVAGATRDLEQLDKTHMDRTITRQESQGREALVSNIKRHQDNLAAKQRYLEKLRKEAM